MHKLELLEDRFAIIKLEKLDQEVLNLLSSDRFISITKTDNEVSIITSEANLDTLSNINTKIEKGFKALRIVGQLDFTETGVLESILKPLADEGISVLSFSTFDTDYILIKEDKLTTVKELLKDI